MPSALIEPLCIGSSASPLVASAGAIQYWGAIVPIISSRKSSSRSTKFDEVRTQAEN